MTHAMRPLPRRGFLATLSTCCLLLAGCAPRKPLRVAAHPWVGNETLFLARQHGWLDPTWVRLVETPTAYASLHLLRVRMVEAASLTLDEVLRARALGLPSKRCMELSSCLTLTDLKASTKGEVCSGAMPCLQESASD